MHAMLEISRELKSCKFCNLLKIIIFSSLGKWHACSSTLNLNDKTADWYWTRNKVNYS